MSIGARIGPRVGARIGARVGSPVGGGTAPVVIPLYSLQKTSGTGAFDAGVSSVQTAAGDCRVEVIADSNAFERVIGLSVVDADVNYTSIDFGLDLTASPALYIMERDTGGGAVLVTFSNYIVGDVIAIERVGTAIRYYQNATLVFTSAKASVGALRIDTSFATVSGKLDKLRFFDNGVQKALTWQLNTGITIT